MKCILPEREGLARFLTGQGWKEEHAVSQLGAGNRHGVFLLACGDRRAVLKLHEPAVQGRRDAFAHEVLMHSFYADAATEFVPRLLAQATGVRALLFDYVPGVRVSSPGEDDVQHMVDFLLETNRPDILDRARQLRIPPASEGGSSAREHCRCALLRLDDLLALRAEDDATRAMQEFVKSEVRSALVGSKPETARVVEPCLSPSDFGFHNVIRRGNGSLCFIDFEHAGWDDPAKLVADFALQPEAPLTAEHLCMVVEKLQFGSTFRIDLKDRVKWLLPVQKAKWTGIILNVFQRPGMSVDARLSRLAKARQYWQSF